MLPLRPPPRPVDPGYPTRDRILGDRTLRRQALGVLAAAVLTGCAGEPVPPPQPTGGTPVPAATPEPNRLPGEASAPTPQPVPPAKPQNDPKPVALGGAVAPSPPPEPVPLKPEPVALGGLVAVPPPPAPEPLRGDVAMPEPPEPAPLRGKVVSDPPPPAPVKP